MSIVWIISFIGWILSFGALVFQIARKNNTFLPLIVMWVFVIVLWITK